MNTLQPLFFPGFTFSWVSLISHRLFMPKLLMMKDKEVSCSSSRSCWTGPLTSRVAQGWSSFHRQLISLFRFLAPFLRRGELGETTRALYLGTQRIILVLLHDMPNFLSEVAFSLCDAIPSNCIQLRNLILSAFPVTSSLRLPDPLLPGLKIELIPDINKAPEMLMDFTVALTTAELRAPLDKFLQARAPATFPAVLQERLLLPGGNVEASDVTYNIPLMNALVLYLGVVALNQSKAQTGAVTFNAKSTSSLLLQQLMADLDPEGGLACPFAPHSRIAAYPSFFSIQVDTTSSPRLRTTCASLTAIPSGESRPAVSVQSYQLNVSFLPPRFSSFLLAAFSGTADEVVKEQIVRVLLERIIVSRPYVCNTRTPIMHRR